MRMHVIYRFAVTHICHSGLLRLMVFMLMFMAAGLSCDAAFAGEIGFEASLDRGKVQMGQGVQLQLRFEGTRDVPAPELPGIEGLQSRYMGPSTMMSIVNGRMSSSITHIYSLVPLRTGTFRIGPLSFEHGGDRYSSNAVDLEVSDGAPQGDSRSGEPQRPEKDLKDRVFVRLTVEKTRIYLNEVIPLSIKLYVSGVSVRDIQYPELKHEYISAAEFDKPLRSQEQKGGVQFEVIEFRTKIFPARAGRIELGPAVIRGNLAARKSRRNTSPQFDGFFNDDFFGGYELVPLELASNAAVLTVQPLPDEGKPADFNGAVGDYTLSVAASPSEVKVGDPVTLTMKVEGEGNFSTVTAPLLKNTEGFKTYDPQARQEADKKIFEQVIIPMSESPKATPQASFTFFDPRTGRYKTAVKGGEELKVMRSASNENTVMLDAPREGSILKKEVLGKDIIYIKSTPGPLREKGGYLYRSRGYQLLHLLPLVLFVTALVMKKKRERLSSDAGYARRLSAPRKAKKGLREAEDLLNRNMPREFYDAVFRTLREYLGNRFHVPSGGLTAGGIDEMLGNRNLDGTVRTRLKHILEVCDMVRYAPADPGGGQMREILNELKEVIDHLERHRER